MSEFSPDDVGVLQARMGQLMVKETYGGICGDRGPFNILDHIS